jgi:hypothetical protein
MREEETRLDVDVDVLKVLNEACLVWEALHQKSDGG